MSTRVWIMRSILVAQLVSALKILPQHKQLIINSREPVVMETIHTMGSTEPTVQEKGGSNNENTLINTPNQDIKSLRRFRPKNRESNRPILRMKADHAAKSPQQMARELVEEQELTKIARSGGNTALSELLGKPYVETRGRNDYLVIQSKSVDPFVTVVPNAIYYGIEKKCVNWLDVCSLKGMRAHLLERAQST